MVRRLVVLIVVLAATSVSCSGGSPTSTAVDPVARAEVQDLTVAVGADPFRGNTTNVGLMVDSPNPGIFETLTTLTPSFGLTAGLASRWEAETASLWRFHLRAGVRFHDGSPLTATAVAETLRSFAGGSDGGEVAGLETVTRRQSLPRGLTPGSATAESDLVVRVALSEPNLRLAEQLSNPSMAVVAPGSPDGGDTSAATIPTGTGPFRFASYTPGAELRVVANHEYWDGSPELTSITFRFGPDEDASRLLATRQVQLVGSIPPSLLASVSGRSERAVASPAASSAFLLLNRGGVGEWATLQEDDLRRALALAVDREAVAEAGWPDHGEPNGTLIPPVVLNDDEAVVPPAHDPAGARQLLDDARWILGPDGVRAREGERLSLSLLVRSPDVVPVAAGEALRTQLAAVGVELEITERRSDDPSPLQQVNAATFDLFLDVRTQDDANPCALCRLFSIRPGGQLTVSGVVGAGPEGDALFDRVHEAPSLDSARRVATELMSVVINDEVVAIPLAALANPWLVSSEVQGFEPASVAGAQRWDSVFLAE